jgi:UDP-N-acetylglucosamine 4,6-dehydratase/5-epimerase
MLNHQSVFITGGTGSFGSKFVEIVLQKYPKIKKLVVFSRDEYKQYEMRQKYPAKQYPSLHFRLGDIRDKQSLQSACKDIDMLIHAAALKQVMTGEQFPLEYIKTNILGTQNVIEAGLEAGVQKMVAISSDKATAPSGLYGATKLCADKLFIHANESSNTQIAVVKMGNIAGARGSVIPLFLEQAQKGTLSITHPDMTRFLITAEQSVDFVCLALEKMLGGEVFIPKIPSFKIIDLAEAICPACQKEMIGVRYSERLHEEMISLHEAPYTLETDQYYVVLGMESVQRMDSFLEKHQAHRVPTNFEYLSHTNPIFLSREQLKEMLS